MQSWGRFQWNSPTRLWFGLPKYLWWFCSVAYGYCWVRGGLYCLSCQRSWTLEWFTYSHPCGKSTYKTHCLGIIYYVNFLGGLGSNEFHINEGLAPMAVEKIKILGAVLELPAKQHSQFGPFTKKLGKMGWIGSW